MPRKPATNSNIIIQQVNFSQPKRENLDINKWRTAVKSAESITSPRRADLYDIYNDILIDTHLTSVIQKRKTGILNSEIIFTRNGEPDEKTMEQIISPWFFSFMSDIIDTLFWGHSLFQFYKDADWIKYDLIPRKHINPKTGMFLIRQTDTTGINYRETFANVFECGNPDDLGLLCKAAPYVIYKRNCMGDYAQFAEVFGQPMREGVYDGYDEIARQKLKEDLEQMGSSGIFIHPENTQIKLIDSSTKTPASGMYTDLIELCNAEISKLILGNTLTTQQGDTGTQALGTVHESAENEIKAMDRKYILDILNYDLSDIFKSLGINTDSGRFMFIEKQSYDPIQKAALDLQIASKVPIADDYWYETYGIPKPDNYDQLKADMQSPQSIAQPFKAGNPDSQPPSAPSGLKNQQKKGFFSFFSDVP